MPAERPCRRCLSCQCSCDPVCFWTNRQHSPPVSLPIFTTLRPRRGLCCSLAQATTNYLRLNCLGTPSLCFGVSASFSDSVLWYLSVRRAPKHFDVQLTVTLSHLCSLINSIAITYCMSLGLSQSTYSSARKSNYCSCDV